MHLPTMRCLAVLSLLALAACGGGGGGSSSSNTPPTPPPASYTAQVLINAGFESSSPMAWQGDTGIIQPADPQVTYTAPHGGSKFAWLDGYTSANTDQIYQDVFVPATAQSAKVDFYLKVVTNQTGSTPVDLFTVSALDTSGNTMANGVLLTKSNADALSPAAYAPFSVDLLPFKGKVVRLSFKGVQAGATATAFLVDDVTATIGVPTATDLKPIITSFTPSTGQAGLATVQISGMNFFGLTNLIIGGASATYILKDGTSLNATLPLSAAAGAAPISLTNAQGTGSSATNFTVTLGVPVVTGMNPTQGPVGTPVVLSGANLGYPGIGVTLNGTAITPITATADQIAFTIPAGATSGNVVVTIPGGSLAPRPFTVTSASATLDLHIEKLQLTQSTQTLDNSVPIVAGKAGLLRLFVLANQANTATPPVQVTLLNNGVTVAGYPKLVTSTQTSVPQKVDESSLGSSWNLAIPATDLTTPAGTGYSVQAVVDPTNTIVEADRTNNQANFTFGGTTVPTFKTTIFPVVLASGTGNVSSANKDAWVARLAKMYPVASLDVQVGAAFTPSVSTLDAKDEDKHWSTLLSDLATKHMTDGASDRYYFGALNVSYPSGIAGLGYVPNSPSDSFKYRTAIGWDKASGYKDGGLFPEVFAHETGHNMGRQHSPCTGGSDAPANPDPNYPYAGGGIGVWGYDTVLNALHSPSVDKDIMGYCTPNWVSDYVYKKILDFRGATGGFLNAAAEDAPLPKAQAEPKECLIVRGIVHGDGRVEFLPAFRTRALPSSVPETGAYTLQCLDQKGKPVFSGALELVELGCGASAGERHFVMALPLGTAVLDAVAGLEVIKEGLVKARLRSTTVPTDGTARIVTSTPEARRIASDQMQINWDAAVHPTAMVRDADTGEVIAFVSGGRQTIPATGRRFDVVLSDGVTGPTHRLEAAQ
ncbi:MAG: hypothetical protein HY014_02285 [Acidobacteria bacterium]|nr:hypothetical protein [Acidobacteriota bacterium]MBI3486977.1 hypothetical protein [Acidobacteriota bacterium]